MSLRIGCELDLAIDSLAAGGDGVGRIDGRVVFVPRAAPGDTLRVRVTQVKARFARADPVALLRPGPARREAPCRYFAACGGCSWMHLDESAQTTWRARLLAEALERVGGRRELPRIEPIASPLSLGYRARARVAVDRGRVGFRARRSREIVPIDRCLVLDLPTQAALERLRAQPPRNAGDHEIRGIERPLGLRVSPGAFFQANGSLFERWAEQVAECCGRGSTLLELYAGVGFYTVRLAKRFERVIAVESGVAASDLRHNTSAEVHDARVEDFLEHRTCEELHRAPDVVLLNPPRVGCRPGVMETLAVRAPGRIVYVSCDPATLARDLARLGAAYEITRLLVLDALPQTHHVESIVVLESKLTAQRSRS